MVLRERDDGWRVEESAWGLAGFLAALALGALLLHRAGHGGFDLHYPLGVWSSGWFVAAHVLAALALLLLRSRRWTFDFAAREVRLGEHGLIYHRSRRIPFADLRAVCVPFRPIQDEGRRLGALLLCHARGVERFRPWSKPEDHAEVDAIARRLSARLGLGEADAGALVQELLANGAVNDAIEAKSLFEDLALMQARIEVQRVAGGHRAPTGNLALIHDGLRQLSLEQAVMLLLMSPLLVLVLLFGRERKKQARE